MALKREMLELEKELTLYADSDPAKIEEAKRALFLAKEGALRWTGSVISFLWCSNGSFALKDNYGILLGYFTRQNGVEAAEIRKYLGIEDNYEDIY